MADTDKSSIVEAKMVDPLGIEISVKGEARYVDFILSSWQRRASFLRHRLGDDLDAGSLYKMNNNQPLREKTNSTVSPSAKINELIAVGFLSDYKTLSEISEEIQKRFNAFIPTSTLHPTLMSFEKKEILQRQVLDNGKWGYKKREGENGKQL